MQRRRLTSGGRATDGSRSFYRISTTASRSRLYVAIGQPGGVDVIETRGTTLAQALPTEAGAHTTAFDRAGQRLYVFLPRSCRAAVYEENRPRRATGRKTAAGSRTPDT